MLRIKENVAGDPKAGYSSARFRNGKGYWMTAPKPSLPDDMLPISDYYTLLASRTYIRTSKRIVALCALESRQGYKELKLYDWCWKGDEKGWKVDLANLNVANLNLRRVASDAEELAHQYLITLNWK